MKTSPGLPLLPLIWTLSGLLGLCVVGLVMLAVAHVGSPDLSNSLLGLAGLCVAALVGLLGAQQSQLHTIVNSRMDELVTSTRQAAFARGQAATDAGAMDPGGTNGPPPPATP